MFGQHQENLKSSYMKPYMYGGADFAKGGAWKWKFLWRHFDDVF